MRHLIQYAIRWILLIKVFRKKFSILYFTALWLAAVLFQQWLQPQFFMFNGLSGLFWRDVVIKNLYWTIPALLLMAALPVCFEILPDKLFRGKIHWLELVIVACVSTCFLYTMYLLNYRKGTVFLGRSIPAVLLYSFCAGTTEEFVFRGFLLNHQCTVYSQKIAMLVNAVMFVLIHYTSVVFTPSFWNQLCSMRSVLIFVMGLVLGRLFLKSRNLAVPMLVHFYWDVLSCWWGLTG